MTAREVYKTLKENAYGGQYVYVIYNKETKKVDIHNWGQGLQWWRQYAEDQAIFIWLGRQEEIPTEAIFSNLVCFDNKGNLKEE